MTYSADINHVEMYTLIVVCFFPQSALSQLYFSFGDVPQSLASTSPSSSLVSSHLLHPHHHTLMLTLPPRSEKGRGDLDWYSIDVNFHAPKKYIDGQCCSI